MNYLLYAIGYRYEIIIAVINLVLNLIVGMNVVYVRPLTQETLIVYMVLTILSMLNASIFNMLLAYLGEVKNKLHFSNLSNINLLNGMHEGLLILSNSTLSEPSRFLYCNSSALKLITTFVGPIDQRHNEEKIRAAEREIMSRDIFNLL